MSTVAGYHALIAPLLLLYNFDSFCLILFKFTPHFNH